MTEYQPPHSLASWQELLRLAKEPLPHLPTLLKDVRRTEGFCVHAADITLEYAHQRVDHTILNALLALAKESQVQARAMAMFCGEPINSTENRAVLHVALRGSHLGTAQWQKEISTQVELALQRFCDFAQSLRTDCKHEQPGFASFTDVVNLGIGGSDLGPKMACQALTSQAQYETPLRLHFVSNVDPWSLFNTLKELDPKRTLFIVQSKSFTTQETMLLAHSAKAWLIDQGLGPDCVQRQFVAVTANTQAALHFGIAPERIFEFWDWVGGRYSIWSSIGLPVAIAIGPQAFREFLSGAKAMDEHFMHAPLEANMPILMALLGVWNRNFLGASSHHIASYVQALSELTPFIQQMDMESNGKSTHLDGSKVLVDTGPILWGGLGNEGQHAYFQLIHQGQHLVPIDFIGQRHNHCPTPHAKELHQVLLLNLLAQRKALALGRDTQQTFNELMESGMDARTAQALAPHRSFEGNSPSSTLWFDQLNAKTLGALIALYEHKIFTQACIWGINAYDQWGVELGKKMAQEIVL